MNKNNKPNCVVVAKFLDSSLIFRYSKYQPSSMSAVVSSDWLTLLTVVLVVAVTTFTCTVLGKYIMERLATGRREVSGGTGG